MARMRSATSFACGRTTPREKQKATNIWERAPLPPAQALRAARVVLYWYACTLRVVRARHESYARATTRCTHVAK